MKSNAPIDIFKLANANTDWLESEHQRITTTSSPVSEQLKHLGNRVKEEWTLSI